MKTCLEENTTTLTNTIHIQNDKTGSHWVYERTADAGLNRRWTQNAGVTQRERQHLRVTFRVETLLQTEWGSVHQAIIIIIKRKRKTSLTFSNEVYLQHQGIQEGLQDSFTSCRQGTVPAVPFHLRQEMRSDDSFWTTRSNLSTVPFKHIYFFVLKAVHKLTYYQHLNSSTSWKS